LRELRKPAKGLDPAAKADAFQKELGPILSQNASDAEFAAMLDKLEADYPSPTTSTSKRGAPMPPSSRFSAHEVDFDVPFAVGKAR
jgi:hypothetical protein